jgi:hypothetical protein
MNASTETLPTFEAKVIQFIRPYGDKRHTTVNLPLDCKADYDAMQTCGCRIESEVLMSGEVSVTIADPMAGSDLGFSITPNGPEVVAGLIDLLKKHPWQIIQMEATPSRHDTEDKYDWSKDPSLVAAERGLVVVFPKENQLQIDIDSDAQATEFRRRLDAFPWIYEIEDKPSASGLPNRHVTLTIEDKTFTEVERMFWQAALNDDPLRVFLNALRYDAGVENPSRLFEKPEPVES